MTDPTMRDRLRRAADPLEIDVEAHLASMHRAASAHVRRRRISALVVSAILVLAASAALMQLRGGFASTPGAGMVPSGTIAYLASSDLTTMSVRALTFDGPDVQLIESLVSDANISAIEFSPDGTQLAYAYRTPDASTLIVANADGSDAHEVGHGLGVEQLSWGPDGSHLAVIAWNAHSAGNDVGIFDLGTGDITRVPGASGYWWNQIAWSPDGRRLALAGKETAPGGADGIYLLPIDGGSPIPLKSDLRTEFMDWSPDGAQLAFSIHGTSPDRGDYHWDVAVINADGTGYTKLTNGPSWDNFPVWSPDGQWIAFSSDRGASTAQLQANGSPDASTFGGVGVYRMRPDGNDVQPVLVGGDGTIAAATDWRA